MMTFIDDPAFHRPGLRTTTWLNTGLGNDTVIVTLTDGRVTSDEARN